MEDNEDDYFSKMLSYFRMDPIHNTNTINQQQQERLEFYQEMNFEQLKNRLLLLLQKQKQSSTSRTSTRTSRTTSLYRKQQSKTTTRVPIPKDYEGVPF